MHYQWLAHHRASYEFEEKSESVISTLRFISAYFNVGRHVVFLIETRSKIGKHSFCTSKNKTK